MGGFVEPRILTQSPPHPQVLDGPKLLVSNTIVSFKFNLGALDPRRVRGPSPTPGGSGGPANVSVRIVCMNATTGDSVCAWPSGASLNANSLGVAVPAFDHAAKSAPVLDVSLVSKEGANAFLVRVPYLLQVGRRRRSLRPCPSIETAPPYPPGTLCRAPPAPSMAAGAGRTCVSCCSCAA